MNGLKNVCEVRRFRLCVYLMLSRSLAMKVSRGKTKKQKTFNVIRTFLMKKVRTCLTAEDIGKTAKGKADIQK